MKFVDRHGLREARAHVLERQGKYWEAITQWFEDNKTPTALDVFLRHINHTSQDPRIMKAITTFLWQNLSFGRRAWPKGAVVRVNKIPPLLVAMSKQKLRVWEQNMASVIPNMFLSKATELDRTDRRLQACFAATENADLREGSCEDPLPSRHRQCSKTLGARPPLQQRTLYSQRPL